MGVLALAVTAITVAPFDDVRVVWKARPGDSLAYVRTQDRTTVSDTGTNKTQVRLIRKTFLSLTAEKVGDDGSLYFTEVITRVTLRREAGGALVELDSELENAPPAVTLLAGASFSFRMSPSGRVSAIRLSEPLRDRISKLPPDVARGLQPASFQHLVPSSTLPEQEVAVGDQWESNSQYRDALGVRKLTTTHTYTGPDDAAHPELVLIKGDTKIEVVPAQDAPVAVTTRSSSSSELVRFHVAAGHMSSREIREEMEMEFEIQGRTVSSKVTGSVTWKLMPESGKLE